MHMRSPILVFVLILLAAPAAAQPIDWWLVLPHRVGEDQGPERQAAEQLVLALQDRRIPVLSMHQASDRLERTSREPKALDPSDIDVLAQEAHEAVRQVAFGNRQAAARSVSRVMQRAERAMETLNRETKNARNVLDACLALVRSILSRGEREGALAEAMRCRRVVPDVTPSEMMHPPSVIGVLAEADDQLRRMQIGQLSVESVPEAGCSVFLNGRHLGTTPFKLRRAAAGEYRIQVECGQRAGRVHTVQLGEKPVDLRVDTVFDQSLRSAPSLALVYAEPRVEAARLIPDAQHVAELTRAYEILLVSMRDEQQVRVQRVAQGSERVLAEVSIPWRDHELDPDGLAQGLDALLAGRIQRPEPLAAQAVSEPSPAARAVAVASPAAVSDPTSKPDRAWTRRHAQLRVGVPLLAAGAGGLIAGWVLYTDARAKLERRDDLPPVPDLDASADEVNAILKAKQRYADARAKPAIAFAGGALGAAAMPWLLPDDPNDPFPWYAWAAGAGGAGLAAVGFWQLSGHNACTFPTESGCQRREDHLPLMSVTFATALPLLAVPLTYALRMPFAQRVDVQGRIAHHTGGASLSLSGTF